MQKIVALLTCISILVSCHKEFAKDANENSQQLLTKIVKTTFLGSSISYNETIEYEYDITKKIVAEGDKRYYRDEKGRIIKTSLPSNSTNRQDIYVHYVDPSSGVVAYTVCDFKIEGGFMNTPGFNFYDSIACRDSTIYEHNNGKLIKITVYTSRAPEPFYLNFYTTIAYDERGNIRQAASFKPDGSSCGAYVYFEYDDKINPIYSPEEVRSLEMLWGVQSISANNVLRANTLINSKHIEYRADGRPRFCSITENGKEAYRITYYYK